MKIELADDVAQYIGQLNEKKERKEANMFGFLVRTHSKEYSIALKALRNRGGKLREDEKQAIIKQYNVR